MHFSDRRHGVMEDDTFCFRGFAKIDFTHQLTCLRIRRQKIEASLGWLKEEDESSLTTQERIALRRRLGFCQKIHTDLLFCEDYENGLRYDR